MNGMNRMNGKNNELNFMYLRDYTFMRLNEMFSVYERIRKNEKPNRFPFKNKLDRNCQRTLLGFYIKHLYYI